MTRVDFYILPGNTVDARLHCICELTERAVQSRQRVFIHADDATVLDHLDRRLWAFSSDSFVAHTLIGEATDPADIDARDPVHLSLRPPAEHRPVLINLASAVPAFFSRFERTIEVVDNDETIRDAGRVRFRFYRERGYPLQHHKLG